MLSGLVSSDQLKAALPSSYDCGTWRLVTLKLAVLSLHTVTHIKQSVM